MLGGKRALELRDCRVVFAHVGLCCESGGPQVERVPRRARIPEFTQRGQLVSPLQFLRPPSCGQLRNKCQKSRPVRNHVFFFLFHAKNMILKIMFSCFPDFSQIKLFYSFRLFWCSIILLHFFGKSPAKEKKVFSKKKSSMFLSMKKKNMISYRPSVWRSP